VNHFGFSSTLTVAANAFTDFGFLIVLIMTLNLIQIFLEPSVEIWIAEFDE